MWIPLLRFLFAKLNQLMRNVNISIVDFDSSLTDQVADQVYRFAWYTQSYRYARTDWNKIIDRGEFLRYQLLFLMIAAITYLVT